MAKDNKTTLEEINEVVSKAFSDLKRQQETLCSVERVNNIAWTALCDIQAIIGMESHH